MAFQGQNSIGVREHVVRTLQAEFGERGERVRPVDVNVIGAIERRADLVKPIFGMIRNPGDVPFTFSVEESADAEQDPTDADSPFANAFGNMTLTGVADGDTIEIDDGTDSVIFEFDDDGTVVGSNVRVPLTNSPGQPELGALRELVRAVQIEWAAGRLGVSAEDITEQRGYQSPATPTARLTHNLTGALNTIAVTYTGATGAFTGGSNGKDPIDFRHYPGDGTPAVVAFVTVPPRGAIQFAVEGATQKYLRFKATPPDHERLLPRGSARPQAFLELAYYHGILEPYERSNMTFQPPLPN